MDVILGLFFGILGFFKDLFDPIKIYKLLEVAITSWPLAIFALIFLLRSQLGALISAIKSASYKDGSREVAVKFSQGVSEIEDIIKNSDDILAPEPPTDEFVKLQKLSKISKRSAIIEAWLSVETAARDILENHPTFTGRIKNGPPMILERLLWQAELVTPTDRELMSQLRKLRNEASHLREFQISDEEAASYIDTALALANRLKQKTFELNV